MENHTGHMYLTLYTLYVRFMYLRIMYLTLHIYNSAINIFISSEELTVPRIVNVLGEFFELRVQFHILMRTQIKYILFYGEYKR